MLRISFGLESGSQTILRRMAKNCTVERNQAFARDASELMKSTLCNAWRLDPDARLEPDLRDRLRRMTGVEWPGAVHGEQRAAFYRAVDLRVFPTVYVHESEPLVILEALAHGVPVVTTRRGCIASVLADGAAVQALDEARFVDAAAAVVGEVCRDASNVER